ncbi:hypothetical protein LUZ62_082865 [Rhynchospora pubera]|uniref:Uncharacterized protein n=1 Tax=Rhynchospora pubera TaxID=906938 RepID=A0AAV8BZ16_9POAL|nr:hypothetical protein LUZ62_082865 [Rhynchospora pubera]
MESCRVKLGGIRSLFSDCGAEARLDWSNQRNSRSDDGLVCPQPRRSFNGRSQFNFDSCGSYTMQEVDLDLDILEALVIENESDDSELEIDNDGGFFYCASPPLRSNNPLSHDPEFRFMGDFIETVKSSSSTATTRSPRSFSPSFVATPVRRIEGFSCGNSTRSNSGANRVLSAFA